MMRLKERAKALAANVADIGLAAYSAAWPRSTASREVERLAEHGYVVGETYDMDFTLSFDEEGADEALAAVRKAGFTITDPTRSTLCYATARKRVMLRAYHIVRATSVLQRIVAPYLGYAAPIGPIARVYVPPRTAERDKAREGQESVHRRVPSSAA
jgi:hypothetical protein